jgi:hypothetical protein
MNDRKPPIPVRASFGARVRIRIGHALDDIQRRLEVLDKHLLYIGIIVAILGLCFELRVTGGQTLFHYAGHLVTAPLPHLVHVVAVNEKQISLGTSLAGFGLIVVTFLARVVRWINNLGSARKRKHEERDI